MCKAFALPGVMLRAIRLPGVMLAAAVPYTGPHFRSSAVSVKTVFWVFGIGALI